LLFVSALVGPVAACGGQASQGSTRTGLPSAGGDAESAAKRVSSAAGPGGRCSVLCQRLLTCTQAAGDIPANGKERAAFMASCNGRCAQEDPRNLDQATTCPSRYPNNCAAVFSCIEEME
jgi:hypothetical protein